MRSGIGRVSTVVKREIGKLREQNRQGSKIGNMFISCKYVKKIKLHFLQCTAHHISRSIITLGAVLNLIVVIGNKLILQSRMVNNMNLLDDASDSCFTYWLIVDRLTPNLATTGSSK